MSVNTLGNAAYKILAGEVDPDRLDEDIERCAWCQRPGISRQCWHRAARVLLDNGLRPTPRPPAPPIPNSR
jgi:hypothetical protein